MAVTLGSTGITFPNGTTQTTAATPGSMTLIGSGSLVQPAGNSLIFTNIGGPYKQIQFTWYVKSGGSVQIHYSVNNGSSYVDLNATAGLNSSYWYYGNAILTNTSVTAFKILSSWNNSSTNYLAVSNEASSGVVNAVKFSLAGYQPQDGYLYVYGIN